jgi:hypothetical protein
LANVALLTALTITMNIPTITPKQQTILQLIYTYRFINRTQLQALLNHKDKRRISAWLKDLRDKEYIDWIYDAHDFAEKTKLAIYYLSLNGIRYLRSLDTYPPGELRKRYKELSRQLDFISRCLLIADCAVSLQASSKDSVSYTWLTQADYSDRDSDYYFLDELKPHLCFIKQNNTITQTKTINYLLEVFDSTTPRYMVKKRLKDYVEYLIADDWEDDFDAQPIVLLACPSTADLIYAKRRTRKLFENAGADPDEDQATHIRFTTIGVLNTHGVTGKVWET